MGNIWGNVLTLIILLSVIIVGYLKLTKKTLKETIQDIKEIFKPDET